MNKKELRELLGHVRKSEWSHHIRAMNVCKLGHSKVEDGIELLEELGLDICEIPVSELIRCEWLPESWRRVTLRKSIERKILWRMIYTLRHVNSRCPHLLLDKSASLMHAVEKISAAMNKFGEDR